MVPEDFNRRMKMEREKFQDLKILKIFHDKYFFCRIFKKILYLFIWERKIKHGWGGGGRAVGKGEADCPLSLGFIPGP